MKGHDVYHLSPHGSDKILVIYIYLSIVKPVKQNVNKNECKINKCKYIVLFSQLFGGIGRWLYYGKIYLNSQH